MSEPNFTPQELRDSGLPTYAELSSALEALRGVLAKKDQLIDRLQTEITRWIDNSYGA